MAKNVIIGSGFLATALKKRLGDYGWYPEKDTEVIFYFRGARHMDYEKSTEWHEGISLTEFQYILWYCEKHKIKLIYPSSALIYEKSTNFTFNKKTLEELASKQENTLGLRIFPVYGVGSQTVINEWCKAISSDTSPVIWGDGEQERDFIFIDDFIDQVLASVDKVGIQDIGTGMGRSFNDIVTTINRVLDKDIKPTYIEAPEGYSKGIVCMEPLSVSRTLEQGIRKICENI